MPREQKVIFKELCAFDPKKAGDKLRLRHDCYMILVGRILQKNPSALIKNITGHKDFDSGSDSDSDCDEVIEDRLDVTVVESERIELLLEYETLEEGTDDIEERRKGHFVFEDNFNPSLFRMVESNMSFEELKRICRIYETKEGVDVEKAMALHDIRVAKSTPFFIERNLPENEAKALALAISFYTGTRSETVNRGASIVARQANGVIVDDKLREELNEAAIILYYLVKALSYIPYYWGFVTRCCKLEDEELDLYTPGFLITWIQFSSSTKNKNPAKDFKHRNTYFKIYSLTGRPIQKFSNFPKEDEVLFLPHSTFIVFQHLMTHHGTQHTIYMRQVELGLCEWSVLWVDDEIFNESWENKHHMESASANALNLNVHFIPKSSTDNALSFLRSPFGQRLKNKNSFRIVTDMNRKHERPIHNAGARLIKGLRELGYRNECMVFTSDKTEGDRIIKSELNSSDREFVMVTTTTSDLHNFVNFNDKRRKSHQSNTKNLSKSNTYQEPVYHKNDASSYKSTTASAEGYQGASGGKHDKTYANIDTKIMHNPMNTDIGILIRNCQRQNLTDDRYNCVLITTGSFNPVHPFHFQNLLRVKQYLEHEHQPPWNVLAGYISPTHDSYVRSKLGNTSWIPARDRCKLCEEAIEQENSEISSWIRVSRGESEWADGFVDFGPVTENFRDFLNNTLVQQQNILKYPLRVVYVCGLDHFNKCSYVERMAKQNNMGCAVVYRVGYEEQQIRHSVGASGVIYIPLAKERNKIPDVSSTQIRQYFENPGATKTNIEQSIYPNVREYMNKKYKKK